MVRKALFLLLAAVTLAVAYSCCNSTCYDYTLSDDFRVILVEEFKQQILDKLGLTHPPNSTGVARPKPPPNSRLMKIFDPTTTDYDSANIDILLALTESREYLTFLFAYTQEKF